MYEIFYQSVDLKYAKRKYSTTNTLTMNGIWKSDVDRQIT
jgi:hypothetical protein